MKTKILKIAILAFVVAFTGCEQQENIQFDGSTAQTLAKFTGTTVTLPVRESTTSTVDIMVEVTSVSNVDRTIDVSVASTSNATPDQYSISEFIIPAGEYIGTGTITGVYNPLPAVGEVVLNLKLDGVSGDDTNVIENDEFIVKLSRFCDFDINTFIGTYSAGTYNVIATQGPEANTLILSNIENRGSNIDIIIELTPDVYSITIRKDLDDLIYVNSTFGNVDPGNMVNEPASFNQCSGELSLNYSACIPDGRCFGDRSFTLTKI